MNSGPVCIVAMKYLLFISLCDGRTPSGLCCECSGVEVLREEEDGGRASRCGLSLEGKMIS